MDRDATNRAWPRGVDSRAATAVARLAIVFALTFWASIDASGEVCRPPRPLPPVSVDERIAYERQVTPVRAILTAEAVDQAWDEGRAMTLDDAVRYALDEQAGRDN